MITNKGKSILSQYLVGKTSSYGSYLAVGCGARPRTTFSVNIASTESSTVNAGSGNAKIITATAHDFQVGDYVKIYNNNGSNIATEYIGVWQITNIPNNTSFKFAIGDTTARTLATISPQAKVILDFSNKTSMDFEMLRLQVKSQTTYTENGLSVVEISADLPTTNRYEISEIGIFSALQDDASKTNSQNILNFSTAESWKYHKDGVLSSIPFKTEALDITSITNDITITDAVFQANSNNSVFNNTTRIYRQERPRYETNTYFLLGNISSLTKSSGKLTAGSQESHIETSMNGLSSLDKSSTDDEIRIALSIVNKNNSTAAPDELRILLEFASEDGNGSETSTYRYARFHGILESGAQNLSNNRYIVLSKKMSDIEKSQNFSWSQVKLAKIYVSVIKSAAPSSDYFVALDAVKFEYVTTTNPSYGMTGYTILKTNNNLTITKEENSVQAVSFKFVVGV